MLKDNSIHLFLTGNSNKLISALKRYLSQPSLKIYSKKPKNFAYLVYLLDTSENESGVVRDLLDLLSTNNSLQVKTAVVLIGSNSASKRDLEYYRQILQPLLSDSSKNIRLLQTLDLYHENTTSPISLLEKFIVKTVETNKIAVSSNGSRALYLTALPDLAIAINKCLFIHNTAGQTYTIIGEVITDLELAYLLKTTLEKFDSALDIDLNKNYKASHDNYHDLSIQSQALLNWLPSTSISDSITNIVKNYYQEPSESFDPISKNIGLQPLEVKTMTRPLTTSIFPRLKVWLFSNRRRSKKPDISDLHRTEKRGLIKILASIITFIVLIFALPILIASAGLVLTTKGTYQSFQSLRRGDSTKAQQQLDTARKLGKITSVSFNYLLLPGNILAPEITKNINNFILLIDHGQIIIDSAIKTFDLSNHLYVSLLGQDSLGSDQTTTAIKINILALNDNLAQIQLLLKDAHLPLGLDRYQGGSDINLQINTLKSQISNSLPLLDIVDRVMLDNAPKHFIVLIQDNNELRASGGFINTVIFLTFENNHLTQIQAEPSLAIDRLVEGSIPPPAPVKQLLNQANWTFRDSNVDADFIVAGKEITWFIERFKNTHIDGLIALNLDFYKKLLSEFGPIALATGVKIDQGNLSSLASNPATDGSLDIITALSKAFITKITNREISFIPLARSVLDAIEKNEIDLYFPDPNLEDLAKKSGLSGGIARVSCHSQLSPSCQNDTLYLNETNFSVAKTNYYLKRTQNHLVEVNNSGQIKVTLNYDYSFPVPAPVSIRDAYKAYYQLYLPTGVGNLTVTLDNQNLDPSNLTLVSKQGLDKLEFVTSLALNQNHQLKISFISPSQLNLKLPQVAYTLSFIKQAGTAADKFTYTLRYPSMLNPKVLTVPMKTSANRELIFQTDSLSNLSFGVLFKNVSL